MLTLLYSQNKEDCHQYDNTIVYDETGAKESSERDKFIFRSREWQKLAERYSVLRYKLEQDFPDDFDLLVRIDIYGNSKELEELSREVKSIIETLEGIQTVNKEFLNNNVDFSKDDIPFSVKEREEIKIKLGEIENQVVEIIEKQQDVSEESKQKDINLLKEQVEDLIKFSEKSGRNQWKARFESFAINIATSLMFSSEARMTFVLAIRHLLNYLFQIHLYLPEYK